MWHCFSIIYEKYQDQTNSIFFYTFQDHFSVLKINWIFFSLFVEEPFSISFLIILTFKFFTFKKYAPAFSALLIFLLRDEKKLISLFQVFTSLVWMSNLKFNYWMDFMSQVQCLCIKWLMSHSRSKVLFLTLSIGLAYYNSQLLSNSSQRWHLARSRLVLRPP